MNMAFKIRNWQLLSVLCLCACATVCTSCRDGKTSATLSSSVPSGWGEDFAAAQKAAVAANKYILLAFSGSDWCIWCEKMEKDIYSVPSFVQEAKKDFELVMIDMPENQDILSPLAKRQNPGLLEKYGVQGFPCSILVHPDGTEAQRFGGYQEGGPEMFLTALRNAAKAAGPPKKPAVDAKPAPEEKK